MGPPPTPNLVDVPRLFALLRTKLRQHSRYAWSLANELTGLASGLVLFLALAQLLDPVQYGQMGAVFAVATICVPLATVGSSWLLLRRVVVSETPDREFNRSLTLTLIGTVVATAFMAAIQPFTLPSISIDVVVLLLVSQLIAYAVNELTIGYCVALADLRLSAITRIATTVIRLLAIPAFALIQDRTLVMWSVVLAIASVTAAVAGLVIIGVTTGFRFRPTRLDRAELTEGIPYALGNSSEGFLAASDRPILVRYGHDEGAGVYAAGYRVAALGLIPLMAIIRANDRSLFQSGAGGLSAALVDVRRITKLTVAAGAAVGLGLATVGPFIMRLLVPDSFSEAGTVVLVLAGLPVLKAIQFPIGNALTATGLQRARMIATTAVTILNFGLNLIFVPSGGWTAAAVTTLVSEFVLSVLFWSVAIVKQRDDTPQMPISV